MTPTDVTTGDLLGRWLVGRRRNTRVPLETPVRGASLGPRNAPTYNSRGLVLTGPQAGPPLQKWITRGLR